MGRRNRRRGREAGLAADDRRDHPARISCSDKTWATFKIAVGSTSVTRYLGAIVDDEVSRWRLAQVSDRTSDAELLDALQRAEQLAAAVARITEQISRRRSVS